MEDKDRKTGDMETLFYPDSVVKPGNNLAC
jgi:hypothetical protein